MEQEMVTLGATVTMKSTKVQTLGAYLHTVLRVLLEFCVLCQCACAEVGHASRFVAVTRGAVSSRSNTG